MIQMLAEAGADLMARNNDDLTALEEVEASIGEEEDDNMGMNDPNRVVEERATPEEVAALLRELMGLGPDEAVPPPPDAEETGEEADADSGAGDEADTDSEAGDEADADSAESEVGA